MHDDDTEPGARSIPNEEQPPAPTNGRAAREVVDHSGAPTGAGVQHDIHAERSVAGAVLYLGRHGVDVLRAAGLEPGDIVDPSCQAIVSAAYDLAEHDIAVDVITVRDELAAAVEQLYTVDEHGHDAHGPHALAALHAAAPTASSAAAHAGIVHRWARRRQRGYLIRDVVTDLAEGHRHDDATRIARAIENLAGIDTTADGRRLHHETLEKFLDADEDAYDWVIDGVLERTDRVLLTGGEGGGKSTLLRQIAVQAASGIHPFTLDEIPPLTVLLLDLENSRKQVRRMIKPLRISAGRRYDQDRLHISCEPAGLDLLDAEDAAQLTQLIADIRPDLVVGGPVYKLVGGDPTEEGPAKAAAMTLDRLRVDHGFALILETHQPHEATGSTKRVERPYGASLWKRWPEFGLHIGATDDKTHVAELRHWRGARDERDWPASLERGGEWPWSLASDRSMTFALILDIARDYAFAHGAMPSIRTLSERLAEHGKQVSKSTVDRAIKANQKLWDQLEGELG